MAIKLRLAKFLLGRTVPLDDNDIIPSNNLGTGGTGAGTKYLADDGTFKNDGFTTIVKSADQDMNNTTGDDTELRFDVVANGVYLIEFILIMSSNNTTADSRYYFRTTSATIQGASTMTNITAAVGGSTQLIQANSNFSAVVAMGTTTAASLDYPLTAHGAITFRSVSNDTLRVGFGVNTATVGAVTRMWKDSYIRYKRIK